MLSKKCLYYYGLMSVIDVYSCWSFYSEELQNFLVPKAGELKGDFFVESATDLCVLEVSWP